MISLLIDQNISTQDRRDYNGHWANNFIKEAGGP